MKVLIFILALIALTCSWGLTAPECPHDLETLCIHDINQAYPVCEKAAAGKGKDVPADLNCLKYFSSMSSDCWPCICWVASINKWNIKGC